MSTKKDVAKSTITRKSSTSTSKIDAKTREDSMDRKKKEKMEIPIKHKATSLKTKKEIESDKKSNVPKSSSRTVVESKVAVSKKKLLSDEPKTPSGSKITKSQFFPSKNMYSNALKVKENLVTKDAGDNIKKTEKEKLSSRKIIKPTKDAVQPKKLYTKAEAESTRSVSKARSLTNAANRLVEKLTPRSDMKKLGTDKMLRNKLTEPSSLESNKSTYSSPDTSTISERPRTATLRKGSIVNANIVGPDAPKPAKSTEHVKSPTPRSEEEFNYEDDFDSYESDFEKYSSSSSNAEIISGEETSSVPSSSDDEVVPRELVSAQKKVTSAGSDEDRKLDSGHFDMPDYKHKQILENIKESVEKENTNLMLHINPASLSDEGFEEQKSLQMINFLDAQKKYEHRKSVEIKRKRGEDILSMIRLDTYSFTLFDLPPVPYDIFINSYGNTNTVQVAVQTGEDDVNEEIQTDEIDSLTKWTQAPVAFSNIDEDDPQFWQKYKYDYLGVGKEDYEDSKTEPRRFNEHSLYNFFSSAGNLVLRLLEESKLENTIKLERNPRPIPFSDGYIPLNTSDDIFKYCTVTCITFSCDISGRIMTVHSNNSDGDSVLAIWRISDPKQPEAIYLSHGVSCCSFGPEKLGLIFAGLDSGTLSVWHIRQQYKECSNYATADFCTDIGFGHESRIVGLHPIGDISESSFEKANQANEICSLDENGEMILWTVIMKNSTTNSAILIVLLVVNSRVSLQETHPSLVGLQCTDFVIDDKNTNFAFISTNHGFIIHHLMRGGRSNVKMFLPDSRSLANNLEICPFSPNYFLAGHQNGDVNLYSRLVEKPLMVFSDKESSIHQCGVELIQWSRNKPFVIYTKDGSNKIHIWDLSESDMHPVYSVPAGNNITCMKLSPSPNTELEGTSYMVIGTEDGLVFIHQLNEEHAQQPINVFDEQVRMFLNYVSRL